jgi:hypothetical protein
MMTEQLPIAIKPSIDLIAAFTNIAGVSNKLEAQLNFHTLTAGWYGDENNILLMNFYLVSTEEFKAQDQGDNEQELLADDVMLATNDEHLLNCYVAITLSEWQLLTLQPKLLSGYLAKKLTKVLNLIAKQKSLTTI